VPVATHVALIRGINVGGNNIVPMAALRSALDAAGFEGVRTYIQSGNVLLAAPGRDEMSVAAAVEGLLESEFGVATVVVAVSSETLRLAVSDAPAGFGTEPDVYHYDVAFLHPRTSTADALAAFGIREGVDTAWEGKGAVYFRRLSAQRTLSKMSSVVGTVPYRHMTIRNWRTTTRLVAMLDED
jgi:uncharacterized protein (DUF1697 family)